MGKKWGQLPRGVTIRPGAKEDRIQINFEYKGVRCRELLKIPANKSNIRYAGNLRGEILNKIEREVTTHLAMQIPEKKYALNQGHPPVYLRTDPVFGLKAGGSVAHTLGVINHLDQFGKTPLFFPPL